MEYLSLGTLIEQAKGTTLVALSARFRFRNKAMQPALCPKLLPWSGMCCSKKAALISCPCHRQAGIGPGRTVALVPTACPCHPTQRG